MIPSRFSAETNALLKTGMPTRRSRDEIVNALATLILVHTIRPTPNDYNIICKKLVDKHPVLRDHIGSGFVSKYFT